MAYTVFARKYRPQTFEELVGQEHVARTLANAITQDRVAHAFLFTGVRGVGKTTTARLLAKALNCEKGPTPTPCNECDACRDIASGVDMDVQEIDGASNNSVEDVRRLQESLPFRPARDRFKVVIVDEVHMLSTGAFNAFLKTLEEPPPHVKFIFATTESHKVPVTIRSRCQRYDFRLIPQSEIATAVRKVLEAEQVKADDGAVAIVAREAAGSMRDALTLLDQLVAFGGEELMGDRVAGQLGIAARGSLHELLSAVLEGRAEAVVRAVAQIVARGTDPTHFVRQLVELLRDLVVLRVVGTDTDLVDLVEEERQAAAAIVGSQDPLELQRCFSAVAKLVDEVAKASSPWLVLEMGLVRVATRPPLHQVSELIARLEALEGGGGSGPQGGPRRGRGPSRGGRGPSAQAGPSSASPDTRAPRAEAAPPAVSKERPQRPEETKAPSVGPKEASGDGWGSSSRREEPRKAPPRREEPRREAREERPRREEPRREAREERPRREEPRREAREERPRREEPRQEARREEPRREPRREEPRREARKEEPRREEPRREAREPKPRPEPRRDHRPEVADEPPPWDDAPMPEFGPGERMRSGPGPKREAPPPSRPEPRREPPKPSPAPVREPPPDEPKREAPRREPEPSAPGVAKAPAPEPRLRRAALQEWEGLVELLREGKPALAAVLEHGVPRVVSQEKIVLSFQEGSFYGRQVNASAAREAILEAATQRLGTKPVLEIRFDAADEAMQERTVAAVEASRRKGRQEQRRREALSHPAVQEAVQVFPEASGRVQVRLNEE
ncbi:MAG: DNA polymerase III subunit gamma/tau [Deltaproteobacteria bacterium]|nr:DNA polymerase III subunit gamma/tau [Deltaproteobacteria bacterium]